MAVTLHRCPVPMKGPHPCWKVQKALDDAGLDYQVVKGPLRRSKRTELKALTGQDKYPAIQYEDGTAIRRESSELAEMIRSGELAAEAAQHSRGQPPPAG